MDTIYTGDYAVRPFTVLNKATGVPFDLTDHKITYRCEREGVPSVLALNYNSDDNPTIVVVTDAVEGELEVRILGTDTDDFVVGATYFEQVRVEDEDTNKCVIIEQRFVARRAF